MTAALDTLLTALRASGPDSYRCDPDRPDVWHAGCPACGRSSRARRLRIHEDRRGHVSLICSLGCSREQILRAIAYYARRGDGWGWDRFHPDVTARVAEQWRHSHEEATRVARILQREAVAA